MEEKERLSNFLSKGNQKYKVAPYSVACDLGQDPRLGNQCRKGQGMTSEYELFRR